METPALYIPILVVANVAAVAVLIAWAIRRGAITVDIEQTYFYLVALVTFFISWASVFSLTGQISLLLFPLWETLPDMATRQQIANTTSLLLVAMCVWWFHWRHVRRRALQSQGLWGLRAYLYAMMLLALLVGVIVAGKVGEELFKAWFGLVDFSTPSSARSFWRDELTATINLLLTLVIWFYHWRLTTTETEHWN